MTTTPNPAGRLTGRHALVTGSTSGIGRSIAMALAREGATVLVSGRNKDAGDRVVQAIRSAGGSANFVARTSPKEARPSRTLRMPQPRRPADR